MVTKIAAQIREIWHVSFSLHLCYISIDGRIIMHDELGRKWEIIKQWYAPCGPQPLL